MAFAGGHGGLGGVVRGPLSLACGRVMGMMMKRGARVLVQASLRRRGHCIAYLEVWYSMSSLLAAV